MDGERVVSKDSLNAVSRLRLIEHLPRKMSARIPWLVLYPSHLLLRCQTREHPAFCPALLGPLEEGVAREEDDKPVRDEVRHVGEEGSEFVELVDRVSGCLWVQTDREATYQPIIPLKPLIRKLKRLPRRPLRHYKRCKVLLRNDMSTAKIGELGFRETGEKLEVKIGDGFHRSAGEDKGADGADDRRKVVCRVEEEVLELDGGGC